MNHFFRQNQRQHFKTFFWLALLLTWAMWAKPVFGWQTGTAPATAVGNTATSTTRAASLLTAPEREAVGRVRVETIREVTAALSAKEMEGRGTAQPGGDRAAKYIADRITALGFKPLGDNGTYLQSIKFKSSQIQPESTFQVGDTSLKYGADYVAAPPFTSPEINATGGLAFVGYGVVSPDLKRDDYAGLDVKGKIVIISGGHPKGIDEATWGKAAGQQAVFVNAIRNGAAGLIFTNVGSEDQPYSMIADYLSRRSVALSGTPDPPFKLPPILLMGDTGMEKIFAGSGATFAQAMAKAQTGEFASRDLNKTATIALRLKREEGTGSNVAGILEGSDPQLKSQAVAYTAHYDAYGISADGRIYPGAADNALGVGEIVAIAEALAKSPRPKRSIIFLAVTGEEHGLLGAEYWATHPTWPLDKVIADLNFDGIGTEVYGPVKNIVGFGGEYSDLGQRLDAVVSAMGSKIVPDPLPEEKVFYRSDHYAFVKKGVPSLMLLGGPEGDAAIWIARAKKWMAVDYHQPSDTIKPDWNWQGAKDIATIGVVMGLRLAADEQIPAWLPSAPFKRSEIKSEQPKQ